MLTIQGVGPAGGLGMSWEDLLKDKSPLLTGLLKKIGEVGLLKKDCGFINSPAGASIKTQVIEDASAVMRGYSRGEVTSVVEEINLLKSDPGSPLAPCFYDLVNAAAQKVLNWWKPYAIGGAGLLALIGGVVLIKRRR